jgi:hypothetical protein
MNAGTRSAMVALISFAAAHSGEASAQSLPTLQSLPQEVRLAIQDSVKQCGAEVTLKWGFVVAEDVNGDGVDDYVLDYGKFVCGDIRSYFCGSGGCLTQVFVSIPNGKYVKVLDENVRDLRFAYDPEGDPKCCSICMAARAVKSVPRLVRLRCCGTDTGFPKPVVSETQAGTWSNG